MSKKIQYGGLFVLLLALVLSVGIFRGGNTTTASAHSANAQSTDAQNVQILLDQEAIRQLRYQFAEGLDTQNWALVSSVFTPTVNIDLSVLGGPKQQIKREALTQIFQHVVSRPGTQGQNIYTNFRIAIHGNTATSKSYLLGQQYIKGFPGGEEFTLRGEYDDTLVRTADGWKISGAKLIVFFTTGNPNILVN